MFAAAIDFDMYSSHKQAREAFLSGKNVAVFGRAQRGTSTVLSRAISHAHRVQGAGRVGVMAWKTHVGAIICGNTMHKFLDVGIAVLPKEATLTTVNKNKRVRERVQATKVVFIDELPMIPMRWMVVLEYVLRLLSPAHKHALPWGDVQVVVKFCVLSHCHFRVVCFLRAERVLISNRHR